MADERANTQTKILERDIAHLSEDLTRHSRTIEQRFTGIADEQRHQWEKIEESQRILTDLRLKIGSLTAYAVLGSVVGSAVVATLVQIAVTRVFDL